MKVSTKQVSMKCIPKRILKPFDLKSEKTVRERPNVHKFSLQIFSSQLWERLQFLRRTGLP